MIIRTTPELLVYGALADTVRMYFENRVDVTVKQKGSIILITIAELPLYREGTGPVTMQLPAGLVEVTKDKVGFRYGIRGNAVTFKTAGDKAFPHAHIWDSGTPCWNDMPISNLQGLFCVLVNTVTWMNISIDSFAHGGFTRCNCTRRLMESPNLWKEIDAHRIAVSRKVGFDVRTRNPADFFRQTFTKNLTKTMG